MSTPANPHTRWILKAIELSRSCPPSERAFSVGCVIVGGRGDVISTGYSREVNDHEHAEELALRRAEEAGKDVKGATLYSSLEPCSVRLSGRTPCAERILRAGIEVVVFAMEEPARFVVCEGAEKLRRAGLTVIVLGEHAGQVAEVNRHLLGE
jgi:pyrimidine deaminase RibD-like protein